MSRYTALLIAMVWGACIGCSTETDTQARDGGGSLAIETPTLAEARVGQRVEQTIATSGGTTPLKWRLGHDAPKWLSVQVARDGKATLVGTPEHSGTYAFDLNVESADGQRADASGSLVVRPKRWVVYRGTSEVDDTAPSIAQVADVLLLELNEADAAPEPVRLLESVGRLQLQWSHDGVWLAASQDDRTLLLWDMGGMVPGTPNIFTLDIPSDQAIASISPSPSLARFIVAAPPHAPSSACGTGGCFGGSMFLLDATSALTPHLIRIDGVQGSDTPVWAPNGEGILARTFDAKTDLSSLALIDFSEKLSRSWPLFSSKDSLQPQWSPDGRFILVAATDNRTHDALFLISSDTARNGAVARLWRGHLDGGTQETAHPLTWSPDGRWLLLSVSRPDLAQPEFQLVHFGPTGDSEPVVLTHQPTPYVEHAPFLSWSPDAHRLMLTTEAPAPQTLVYDVAAAAEPIWRRDAPTTPGTWTADGKVLVIDGSALVLDDVDEDSAASETISDAAAGAIDFIGLSRDLSRVLYKLSGEDTVVHVWTFSSAKRASVALGGILTIDSRHRVQWLSDSSGFVVPISSSDPVDAGAQPADSSNLETVFLNAYGVPQKAHVSPGGAPLGAGEGFLLQP